jgi:hypothetical protein
LFDSGAEDKTQRRSGRRRRQTKRCAPRGADGWLLYGARKAAGALPWVEIIKSWFSQETRR